MGRVKYVKGATVKTNECNDYYYIGDYTDLHCLQLHALRPTRRGRSLRRNRTQRHIRGARYNLVLDDVRHHGAGQDVEHRKREGDEEGEAAGLYPVSYTHLDVYKRQDDLRRLPVGHLLEGLQALDGDNAFARGCLVNHANALGLGLLHLSLIHI